MKFHILRKKWIPLFSMAFFAVACSCFIFLTLRAFSTIAERTNTTPLPAESSTILLDAGHGGEDGGAVAVDGALEKDINLAITKKLAVFLRLQGFEVILTRAEDSFIGDTDLDTLAKRKKSDMHTRLALMEQYESGIFVSIHQNSFSKASYHGAQVFYSPNREESEVLAQCLQDRIKAQLQPENERAIKRAGDNIFLLKNAKLPAVLVECGFLSNPEEADLLQQETYQNQVAFAIFSGIVEYYQVLSRA